MRRWIALLLVAAAACGRDLSSPRAGAVRDSAGIRIVQLGDVGHGPAWRLDANPTVDLGGAAGGPVLYQVAGAGRLDDGRIVVANGGAGALEVFAADGKHLRSIGRAGDGPGEFRTLAWVGRFAGDTIAAWDAVLGRLSLFTPDGVFARAISARQPLGMMPEVIGAMAGGGVLLAIHNSSLGMGSTHDVHVQRDTVTWVALARDGGVRTVASAAGTEMLMSGNPAGGLMMMPLPFGRQASAAADGERVYVADGDAFAVTVHDAGGARSILRADAPRIRVSADDIRRYRASLVTLGGEGNARLQRQQDQMFERAPYPALRPAITALRADSQGNLWIESPAEGTDPFATRWTIVSPDHRVIGRLDTPARLDIRQIGPDWVLGIAVDADNAEHVRLYRLHRSN